jgi:hypothetical protein
MGKWHGHDNPKNWCNTTHCRAGAMIVAAGEVGIELEEAFGPAMAGAILYALSGHDVPDFYTDNESAMADIIECAKGGESPPRA